MNRLLSTRFALCFALLVLFVAVPASAQQTLGSRTFVPSPQALGMGGAGIAYPTARTALFYNPAHLTHVNVTRAPITMLGIGASISSNIGKQRSFYQDRVQPALDVGIENLSDEEEQALYNDIFAMSSQPTVLKADLLLPSFVMNRGTFGFGGGIFGHNELAYNVDDAGAGVPGLDFAAISDIMAVGATSMNMDKMGLKGLSLGVTGKFTQRYLSLKVKPFDAIDDDESLYILGASTVTADLGVLYEMDPKSIPGKLYFGAVMSDLALNKFSYSFSTYYARNEEEQDKEAIATEVALAESRYQLHSSFRGGVTYMIPTLGGPLAETAVSLDYVQQHRNDLVAQPLLGRLSFGVQTMIGNTLALRTGLNQGYSSFGAGIQLPFARIDYAFYGSELGQLPGQSPSWNHRIQLSLGSF
ncbi:MAG TPA: hypothetical protein VKP65_22115 [Rhodothermales bacterium]|nr:hypothetical protein [Rhodothermales bacterium]